MKIRLLKRDKIDIEKWDRCVRNSVSPLIYGESWWLDIVCKKSWSGLILDDYKAVMPLPERRKLGILKYFGQPPYTQQLGIFHKEIVSKELQDSFISSIPFRPYRLNFNHSNFGANFEVKPNFCLSLNCEYSLLKNSFSQNTKRNITKAEVSEISIDKANTKESLEKFWHFLITQPKPYELTEKEILKTLLQIALNNDCLELHFAYNSHKSIIAALAMLKTPTRLTYFMPISSKEGKKQSAMFAIVNSIIYKNQNTPVTLDFEGSSIAGIARFYKGFGAVNQQYYRASFLLK